MDLATFQGIGQGLNQGISNGMNMGMRLREQESLDKHRQVLEEQTKAQTAVMNLELEKKREMQADYDRPMDLTTMPMFLSMPDEVKPQVLKYYSENGYTDANGRGKKGEILKGAGNMAATKELFQGFMEPVVKAKQAGVLGAWNELQEVKAAGDEKKIQIAQAKYNKLNAEYQSSVGKFDEHLKMLTQHDLKIEEENNKKKKVAFSGGSSFDAETGEPIHIKPDKGGNAEAKRDARDSRKEQLKVYDDAIRDYDHNIQFAKSQLKAAQDYDKENTGSTKYKEMTDSLNENQKQRDITAQRRRDYLSGKQSKQATGAYKTANDVKAAFKAGKIKEAEAVKILKDKFGMK